MRVNQEPKISTQAKEKFQIRNVQSISCRRMVPHTIPYTLPLVMFHFPTNPTSPQYFEDVGLQKWQRKEASHNKKLENDLPKDIFCIYLRSSHQSHPPIIFLNRSTMSVDINFSLYPRDRVRQINNQMH